MDSLTIEQRRRNMQANRGIGTSTEVILAKALWVKGYRYRKNDRSVLGKPDITFKKIKIAVFCDGEFWHGKDWDVKRKKIQANRHYWINKIEKNIERDRRVNEELQGLGWTVLRFWNKEISKKLDECIEKIEKAISNRQKASA